jgi:hypothetical protein
VLFKLRGVSVRHFVSPSVEHNVIVRATHIDAVHRFCIT